MLNKKGAMPGGWLGLGIFGMICIGIMIIVVYAVGPLMEGRAKLSVTESIAEFNENLFLLNYLRYPAGDKTIADLAVEANAKKDYGDLESKTKDFLKELYGGETKKWRIYINDELVVDNLYTSGREKLIHETYIPNYYNMDPIKFKFVFY